MASEDKNIASNLIIKKQFIFYEQLNHFMPEATFSPHPPVWDVDFLCVLSFEKTFLAYGGAGCSNADLPFSRHFLTAHLPVAVLMEW